MATLYVENVPENLYAALRDQARRKRKSIAAEVLEMLEQNVVTAEDLKRRQELFLTAKRLRSRKPRAAGPFPTAEEMLREDRSR